MLFHELPPELLGHTFNCLTLQERCRTIPFLSRTFLRIHKDFPHNCKELDCGRLTRSNVGMVLAVAGAVESLRMEAPEAVVLTEVMALPLGRLRRLEISFEPGGDLCNNLMSSLSPLSQITKLTIRNWTLDGTAGLHYLTGLRSLKKIHLPNIEYASRKTPASAAREFGDSFWTALAALPGLEKADILLSGDPKMIEYYDNREYDYDEEEDQDLYALLAALSSVTQLRSLKIGMWGEDFLSMQQDLGGIYERFRELVNLTVLKLHAFSSYPTDAPEGQEMTWLRKLSLCVSPGESPAERHAALISTTLTCLQLHGGMFGGRQTLKPTDEYDLLSNLPAETPVLPHLRELHVTHMYLEQFPWELTGALHQLTKLNLSPGNFLRTIPTAVSLITTLQILENSSFWMSVIGPLEPIDHEVLAALPSLEHLRLTPFQNDIHARGFL